MFNAIVRTVVAAETSVLQAMCANKRSVYCRVRSEHLPIALVLAFLFNTTIVIVVSAVNLAVNMNVVFLTNANASKVGQSATVKGVWI
ncbi:MAG: hypothetical protein AAGJ35_06225 [Myxococcota bacterium]